MKRRIRICSLDFQSSKLTQKFASLELLTRQEVYTHYVQKFGIPNNFNNPAHLTYLTSIDSTFGLPAPSHSSPFCLVAIDRDNQKRILLSDESLREYTESFPDALIQVVPLENTSLTIFDSETQQGLNNISESIHQDNNSNNNNNNNTPSNLVSSVSVPEASFHSCISKQKLTQLFDSTNHIPEEIICSPWSEKFKNVLHPFESVEKALADPPTVLAEWQKHGFFVVKLDPHQMETLNAAFEAAKRFFSLPLDIKERCKIPIERYVGYHHRPDLFKEFFQVRHADNSCRGFWPPNEPEFVKAISECWDMLRTVANSFFKMVLTSLGMPEDQQKAFLEDETILVEDQKTSRTVLEVFHYYASAQANQTPCGYHTDISCLTIIPRSFLDNGLMLYDWSQHCWFDLEKDAPANHAVIFGGETLNRLTNGFILPGVHMVKPISTERYSFPLLMLGKANALIDSSILDQSRLPSQSTAKPIRLEDFVHQISSSRFSSLFVNKALDK